MEYLYSEHIVNFLAQVKKRAREIIRDEMHLNVAHKRFYFKNHSYPLTILLFESETRLGYFDPNYYEIGLNKQLISSKNLNNVLRHELAHYYTWIVHGPVAAHGTEFKEVCKSFGWGKEVFSATEKLPEKLSVTTSPIALKIQKLLALAKSSNAHEAEAATLKAHTLMSKHDVSTTVGNEEEHRVKRILFSKRVNTKLQVIASILRTFNVYPVLNKGSDSVCLEILGSKEHIEIAEYIAHFLNSEFDRLWIESGLKGASTKNSFFRGLGQGYTNKTSPSKPGLIKLEGAIHLAYPRLSTTSSRYKHCEKGAKEGKKLGKNMQIKKGLKSGQQEIRYIAQI